MKNRVLVVVLIGAFYLSAQTKGLVTYEVSVTKGTVQKKSKSETQDQLEYLHKTSRPVYGFLAYNGTKAIYKVEPNNTIPIWNNNNGHVTIQQMDINLNWLMAGADNLYYSDFSPNHNISTTSLINDEVTRIKKDAIEWLATAESKLIKGYLCHKVILKNNPKITAWYTDEIPIGHGPMNHNGLPGLVLELKRGRTIWEVVDIDFTSIEADFIDEPISGKLISQDDYRKWSKNKFALELIDKN